MYLMLARFEGLFHSTQRDQNPGVKTPVRVQFSRDACRER